MFFGMWDIACFDDGIRDVIINWTGIWDGKFGQDAGYAIFWEWDTGNLYFQNFVIQDLI